MLADAEAIKVAVSCLESVMVTDFKILLNHREILLEMVRSAGVDEAKVLGVCTTIDKADKTERDELRKELLEVRQIPEKAADLLLKLAYQTFEAENFNEMRVTLETAIGKNEKIDNLMDKMQLLLKYTGAYGINKYIDLCLGLTRGLGYYTGISFNDHTFLIC